MRQSYSKTEIQTLRTTIREFLDGLGTSQELTEAEYKLVPKLLEAQKALYEYKELA